jgi:hypothetical protein
MAQNTWFGTPESDVRNWSLYPAITSVDMDGKRVDDSQKITLREHADEPSITMDNLNSQSTLWRTDGDATLRLNNGNILEPSGYVLDTLLNKPTLNLVNSTLELLA